MSCDPSNGGDRMSPVTVTSQAAMIIGAGAGIGRAAATVLAQRGYTVLCVDRDESAASATANELSASGCRAYSWFGDVTQADTLKASFSAALAVVDQVHAVINCAGVQGPLGRASHLVSLDDFDRVIAVNLRGALAVTHMAIPHMLEHGYGRIAHVASIAGKEGNPNMIAYSSSKAGLIGMVKAQGKEYATTGITVNALAPAVIQTPFLDSQPQETLDYMMAKIPMGRAGRPDEAAYMLAWMVSPECSYTTGFTFDLSGGRATY